MQTPTPLTPEDARFIALRQGLLFGTFAGCLAILSVAGSRLLAFPVFSASFIYALAFIAFFVAGWRTAKRTGRIDMGALAGFWAGVAVAILGFVALLLLWAVEYRFLGTGIRLSSLVSAAVSGFPTALLALIFGPAIGTLGGFIGKTYSEPSAVGSALPAQPAPPPAQPATQVQSSPPSPSSPNQP